MDDNRLTAGPAPWIVLSVSGEDRRLSVSWLNELEVPYWCRLGQLLAFESADGCTLSSDTYQERDRRQRRSGPLYHIWPACFVHDLEYSSKYARGTRAARQAADTRLYRNLYTILRLQGMPRARAKSWAWLYWGRVRVWAVHAYPWAPGLEPKTFLARLREVWLG